jgi:hypothetical protein
MSDQSVLLMSKADKIAEAMRRSLPHLPLEARRVVEGMLRPETIAIVSGTLMVWAGSHFFGVGEMVDIILLGIGVVALGFAVFEGAGELYEFGTTALSAHSSGQLDEAGRHFARAVTLLGIPPSRLFCFAGRAVRWSLVASRRCIRAWKWERHRQPAINSG